MNPQKIQGPGTTVKFLAVLRLGKIQVVPEVVIDNVQAYPTPKNVKEVQAFIGIWGFWRTFIPHLAQCLHPLYHLVMRGHTWDWGLEQQAAFQMAKILVKQIKVLGISQAGLPFELDVSVTPEDLGWALWERQQKESTPRIFGPWKGAETQYTPAE